MYVITTMIFVKGAIVFLFFLQTLEGINGDSGSTCSSDGSSAEFLYITNANNEDLNHFVKVETNACPKNAFTNSGTYIAEKHPLHTFYLPKFPHKRSTSNGQNTAIAETDHPIGFLLNGVLIFGPAKVDADAGQYTADCCGGYTSSNMYIHPYNAQPTCVINAAESSSDHSPIVGFLADGFPIYGPNGDSGTTPSDLDACGGHQSDSGADGGYHYHMTGSTDDNFGQCFRGCVADIGPHWEHLTYESIVTCTRLGLHVDGEYAADLEVDEFDFTADDLC